jgi:hypothetical protein
MNTNNKARAIAVQKNIWSQTSEVLGASKVYNGIIHLKNYSETIYITLSKVIDLTVEGQPEVRGKFKFTIYNTTSCQLVANEPVKYQNGCYLIINLVSGTYKITIDSIFYHQVVQDIEINKPPDTQNLITQIELEPKTKPVVL